VKDVPKYVARPPIISRLLCLLRGLRGLRGRRGRRGRRDGRLRPCRDAASRVRFVCARVCDKDVTNCEALKKTKFLSSL
jgi:hypothetical protein